MMKFKDQIQWERMIVQELAREHEHICRIHKVNLKSIGFELFDSETLWGQYNHQTKMISISKNLVDNYSWHFVMGVLHHEMAHQYLAEQSPNVFANEHSHGQSFKEACQRLGVPAPFSRAGLNLKAHALDWRTEPYDESVEKIIDKTKKLLSLANSTNEHEAQLAMARVREIYAKYNLEHLNQSSEENYVHLVIINKKKRLQAWEQRAVNILTEHFFVRALRFQQFDAFTGNRNQALELIGRRENVMMAEFVYQFLLQQLDSLLVQHLEIQTMHHAPLSRSARASFRLGVLDGFDEKLKQTSQPHSPIIHRALVKFRDDPYLEKYMANIYPCLRSGRRWSHTVDNQAFNTGQLAGRKITLHKPISSHVERKGLLLR